MPALVHRSSKKVPRQRFYQFPYVQFHGKYYPLIPITLRRQRFFVSTFALLDSGASISVFRPEIARALRIPLKGRTGLRLDTAANGGVNIAVSRVNVEVEETRFTAKIGFSATYAASFNILGRESFFHRFSIAFNEVMRTVILVPLESLHS